MSESPTDTPDDPNISTLKLKKFQAPCSLTLKVLAAALSLRGPPQPSPACGRGEQIEASGSNNLHAIALHALIHRAPYNSVSDTIFHCVPSSAQYWRLRTDCRLLPNTDSSVKVPTIMSSSPG